MATPIDPVFVTKRDPHVTIDLLRQGWGKAKDAFPSLQKLEDAIPSEAVAAGEGALRTVAPGEPWEVGAAALGPAAKVGKNVARAVGGATVMAAGMEDAEGATGMRKVFYDLLRKHGGDMKKAKTELQGMQAAMTKEDRAQATKVLKADIPEAVVRRELMTNPDVPNVYDVLENKRQQTLLRPDQAFKIGDMLVPVAGDTTHAGVNVRRAGIDLRKPVEMQGGHEYGLTAEAPWASELSAARAKQKSFERAAEGTPGDVLGVHVAMAPQGAHFSKHVPDLYREMIASGPHIPDEAMTAFNADVIKRLNAGLMKKGKEVPAVARALRDWQGVTHADVGQALNANPEMRKALMATADKPGWQHLGFPDMDSLYGAALDTSLQTGDVGGAVMRAAPGTPLTPTGGSHRTYGYNIPGEHMGRLEVPLPPEMVFPDTFARFSPKKRAQALGSLRSSHTQRPVDQQFIDQASEYTDARLKALREGAW